MFRLHPGPSSPSPFRHLPQALGMRQTPVNTATHRWRHNIWRQTQSCQLNCFILQICHAKDWLLIALWLDEIGNCLNQLAVSICFACDVMRACGNHLVGVFRWLVNPEWIVEKLTSTLISRVSLRRGRLQRSSWCLNELLLKKKQPTRDRELEQKGVRDTVQSSLLLSLLTAQ